MDTDLIIANLETPLVDISNTPKPTFSFSSRYNNKHGRFQHWSDVKETPLYLKKYNIVNVSLANNHMLDYGLEGLHQTLESLNNYRIRFFGAGYNRKEARAPFIKDLIVGNKTLRLVVFSAFEYRKAYDEDFSFYASNNKGGVNRLSFTAITKKIKSIRDVDDEVFIVVFPHWGRTRNYGSKTTAQTEMGHKLIDAGADLVIGHGAHNLQQIERYRDHWIIYSLGNFLYNNFGNFNKYNAPPYSLIAKLILEQNNNCDIHELDVFSSNRITKYLRLYPIVIDNRITSFQTRFVNDKEFEFVYKYLIDNKISWKPSEEDVKTGIDKIGRYIDISLG